VHLKKLEVFGFKSFAHKLSLEFGPGITCIVGPNGCGKTNVADAIRWVLGEQSPAELRGSSMSDVIFNGTKLRRRLGMAEVALTIDNSEGFLPTDYSEVLIGRRVFRSGESEYSINKTGCRLRDVRDLFLDTGIGSRTYSLIERRMVDSVLSDSTGHRRFMFEEAAGIMKYKIRKHSTLNKLAATESDMQRVADIILEVEKQVRSLERQLAQARRHRRYTDELRELEIACGRREYARHAGERREAGVRAAELREGLAAADAVLKRCERAVLSLRTEHRDKDEALASLDLEVAELEARARTLAEGLLVARERRSASERRVSELDTELTDIRADLSLALKRAAGIEDDIRRGAEVLDETESALSTRAARRGEIEKDYWRLKEVVDGEKQMRLEGLESSAGSKGELESYRSRLDDLLREHVEIERSLGEMRSSLGDKEREILEALGNEKVALERAQVARETEHQATERLDKAREGLLSSRERKGRLAGELESARRKLELLSEIREGYGGFQDGVRSLLSDRSHGIAGLHGTVADVIDVDPSMALAIETALGSAAQYVVTADVDCAKAAMRHLASAALGRATFVPLSRLQAVDVEEVPGSILGAQGAIGPAARFAASDPEFAALAAFLLEGVVVVEDLDVALALAGLPEATGLAFVTPAGDMVSGRGVLSGGRPGREEAGLLRRSERVEAAAREADGLTRALGDAESNERGATGLLATVIKAASAAEAEREASEAGLWQVKRRVTELEMAKAGLSDKVSQLAANRDALAVRMDRTRRDIQALAARLAGLSKGEDELGERLDGLERQFREAERARAKAADEERQAELETATARSSLAQLRSEHAQLAESGRTARQTIERKSDERTEHVRVVSELGGRTGAESQALAEVNEQKRTLEVARDAMREATRGVRREIERLEDEARSNRTLREELQRELHELEIRDAERKAQSDGLRARLREEYSVDVSELGDLPTPEGEAPFDLGKGKEEVERLRARLRSMGPVNLLALDEYDEESKRLEFLRAQYDDLVRSKDALREAIERINATATRMFLETFAKIRGNFVETFLRLFEGGEADLTLLDPADPLESPIEIVASPRGKRLGRLSLLSGGERALTAIALLFAIYLVKPSPFCMLDEVDAPLDDANVDRFVRMLREFSSRTQFIIITHNKATMQAADRLYGITMEESGVSKVVSVRLDEVGEEVTSGAPVLEAH
jgi:chromosome segregation protein